MICDLIIPALNERANIDALFDALAPLSGESVRRIIIADNGSTDGTAEAAAKRGAIVVHQPQRGYGAACLEAIEWIERNPDAPDVIAFLDADLADDPAQLPRLLEPIRRGVADLVIGSRVRLAEAGALNTVQRFGNAFACTLIRILGGRRYGDLGPFRVIRWPAFKRLLMSDRTWGWTVELQMKAAITGLPSVDVDVPYRTRRAGKSKISGTVRGVAAAGSKILTTIVAIWWQRRAIAERWRSEDPA